MTPPATPAAAPAAPLAGAKVVPFEPGSAQPAAPAALPAPFDAVAAGQLPAVSLPPIEGETVGPLAEFVISNLDTLLAAGLDYHETKDNLSVFFNPKVVTEEAIQKAEKEGTLLEIAPLADQAVSSPPPAEAGAPSAAAAPAPTAPAAPLAGAQAQAAPRSDRKLQTARIRNLKPAPAGAPNPVPGQLAKRAL
jgi:hypothetical protein